METVAKLKKVKISGSEVSKTIKSLLKKRYPKTKFSVRYESFAGGNAINIIYSFGPKQSEIEELVENYEYGSFNSLEDIYEYKKERVVETADGKVILDGGVRYISISRRFIDVSISEISDSVKNSISQYYPDLEFNDDINALTSKLFRETTFTSDQITNVCVAVLPFQQSPKFKDLVNIVYDCNYDLNRSNTDTDVKLQIIDYSNYAIALFGSSLIYSKQLKEAGGKYNKFLTHPELKKKMPGWVFKKDKREEVKTIVKLP